jgi:hypothetical protein
MMWLGRRQETSTYCRVVRFTLSNEIFLSNLIKIEWISVSDTVMVFIIRD